MEFSGQKYWSELPFPSPRDLPNPEIKPRSPVSPALPLNNLGSPLFLPGGLHTMSISAQWKCEMDWAQVDVKAGHRLVVFR